jgi:beta-glucosidase
MPISHHSHASHKGNNAVIKLTMQLLSLLPLMFAISFAQGPVYSRKDAPIERRVDDLLTRLTLEEKVDLLGGTGFETNPVPRLGIPTLKMTDGPLGVRWGQSTAFVSGISMAATWDPKLVHEIGIAIAEEALGKGRNTLLGPCVNIQRVPQGGRDFESYGEDPYLASRLAVAYITGVQSRHVLATVKHYAANNQETDRDRINVKVSERALREIYLPAFEASIKEAGVWAVMDAYNKVNGDYCTANKHLNVDILRKEWGFKGVLMSDWGATHNTAEAANGGLDLEMPTGKFFNRSLIPLFDSGVVSQATLDEKVYHLLYTMIATGIFDNQRVPDAKRVDTPAHRRLNRKAASASMVLLKNQGNLLPLNHRSIHSLAIIGPNAATARVGGGGSSMVSFTYAVSPLDGFKSHASKDLRITYAEGCPMAGEVTPIDSTLLHPSVDKPDEFGLEGEYYNNMSLSGTPAMVRRDPDIFFDWEEKAPDSQMRSDSFSVRWTGVLVPKKAGRYILEVASDDGCRLSIDNKTVIEDWTDHAVRTNSAELFLEQGKSYGIRLEYYESIGAAIIKLGCSMPDDNALSMAASAAAASDVALVFVGLSSNFESEGFDRTTLALPENQIVLIKTVAKANPKTVVVLNSGAPVLISDWVDSVPALIEQWYPGQEGGHAIAEVVFGDFDPGGRLPCTFPVRWEDCSAFSSFPGTAEETDYTDGVFVGYRYFDAQNIAPQYPFGFGLSYSEYAYSDLNAAVHDDDSVTVSFTVKNVGKRKGTDVAQLYVAPAGPSVHRPPKELKGFKKISLKPGAQTKVTLSLNKRAFAYFDEGTNAWRVDPGEFKILIGRSSQDIRLDRTVSLR